MEPRVIATGNGNPINMEKECARFEKIESSVATIAQKLNELAKKIKKTKDPEIKQELEKKYDDLGKELTVIHALHRGKHVLCLK